MGKVTTYLFLLNGNGSQWTSLVNCKHIPRTYINAYGVCKKKHTNSTGNLKLGAFYKIELERISELATNLNQAKSHNISVKVIIHEFTYFPLFVPLTLHSQLLYLSEDKISR